MCYVEKDGNCNITTTALTVDVKQAKLLSFQSTAQLDVLVVYLMYSWWHGITEPKVTNVTESQKYERNKDVGKYHLVDCHTPKRISYYQSSPQIKRREHPTLPPQLCHS